MTNGIAVDRICPESERKKCSASSAKWWDTDHSPGSMERKSWATTWSNPFVAPSSLSVAVKVILINGFHWFSSRDWNWNHFFIILRCRFAFNLKSQFNQCVRCFGLCNAKIDQWHSDGGWRRKIIRSVLRITFNWEIIPIGRRLGSWIARLSHNWYEYNE